MLVQSKRMRSKRAILASQTTRRFVRIAQILGQAKRACLRMTISLEVQHV